MSVPRFAGTPCWIDLRVPDPAAAVTFYGAVLGWTFDDGADMGGHRMARAGGAVVAAVGPTTSDHPRPPGWNVYLHTPDADAAVDAAQAAGGTVLTPPGDAGPFGRMAELRDPGGAVVGLWQPGTHGGFETLSEPGSPVWFEVNTRDSERVRDFFAGVFSLSHEKMGGMTYFTLHAGGRPRYGVLQMDEQWAGMQPHWMVYLSVADTDIACARVTAAGGTVAHGPFDTPFGRIAICEDVAGAAFTLIKPAAGS